MSKPKGALKWHTKFADDPHPEVPFIVTGSEPLRKERSATNTSVSFSRLSVSTETRGSKERRSSPSLAKQYGKDCVCEANLFLKKYKADLEVIFQSKHVAPSERSDEADYEEVDVQGLPSLTALSGEPQSVTSLPRIASSKISGVSRMSKAAKLKKSTTERLRKERQLLENKARLDKSKKQIESKLRYATKDEEALELQKDLCEIERAFKDLQETEKALMEAKLMEEKRWKELAAKEAEMKRLQTEDPFAHSPSLRQSSLKLPPSTPRQSLAASLRLRISMQTSDMDTWRTTGSRNPSLRKSVKRSIWQSRMFPSIHRLSSRYSTRGAMLPDVVSSDYEIYEMEDEECTKYDEDEYRKFVRKYPFFDKEDEGDVEVEGESERGDVYLSQLGEEEPDLSTPMKQAEYYLKKRMVHEFIKFLGAHLVTAKPENPIEYLIYILESCIEYRDFSNEPPLLFKFKHIESLYKSMDPLGSGEISLDQYFTGLSTLGIHSIYHPSKDSMQSTVKKNEFITDAYRLLKNHLDMMIYVPQTPWPYMPPGMGIPPRGGSASARQSHTRSG